MYTKVTISGKICTGKTTLFWGLQRVLLWSTFSASQFFRDYARSYRVSLQTAGEQESELTRAVDTSMAKLLQGDTPILVEGWMAGIMADSIAGVLRILLVCDETERIRRFAKRENVDEKEATQKITERESLWMKKLKAIYGRDDFFAEHHYNCIVDTTKQLPQEVLEATLLKIKGTL